MKKSLWLALGILVCLVIFIRMLPNAPDDSKQEQAAIAVIQKVYTPSRQLLSWNADFSNSNWVAREQGKAICDNHGVSDDCYEVEVWLDVIPNGEKKRITADWLVYDGMTHYQAENVEARTLFVKHTDN